MPGLVKVGLTTHSVKKRASELYTTGVPIEFTIEGSWKVPEKSLAKAESELHQLLREYRYNRKREFFVVDPSEAVRIVDAHLKRRRYSSAGESDSLSPLEGYGLLYFVLGFFCWMIWYFS